MPTSSNVMDPRLVDDFDLDVREITVIQEQQEASASGFTCTLFTCPALTCGSSCTSC
ncbi:hypothetical protein B0I31_104221 [Saccharothrix carnea]|uniref:Uncharacterized protein n=1 Tax=Saccharothrix carnea TaxID=1280637 RepID=A0A2P8IBV2_SACCR|nr:hypothetical protein [Saccharothrix carnea]PSL55930.1 hypothetical protein B0I31_104221 [Saccharothrix carnea]